MLKLSPLQVRAVALEAGCDPRTVDRHLAGKPQRSTTAWRIRRALEKLQTGAAGGGGQAGAGGSAA